MVLPVGDDRTWVALFVFVGEAGGGADWDVVDEGMPFWVPDDGPGLLTMALPVGEVRTCVALFVFVGDAGGGEPCVAVEFCAGDDCED